MGEDQKVLSTHLLGNPAMKSRLQLELLDPHKVSQISVSMNEQNQAYSTCISTAKPTLNSKAIDLN